METAFILPIHVADRPFIDHPDIHAHFFSPRQKHLAHFSIAEIETCGGACSFNKRFFSW